MPTRELDEVALGTPFEVFSYTFSFALLNIDHLLKHLLLKQNVTNKLVVIRLQTTNWITFLLKV